MGPFRVMLNNRLFSIKGLWTHKSHRGSSMIQVTFLDYRCGVSVPATVLGKNVYGSFGLVQSGAATVVDRRSQTPAWH